MSLSAVSYLGAGSECTPCAAYLFCKLIGVRDTNLGPCDTADANVCGRSRSLVSLRAGDTALAPVSIDCPRADSGAGLGEPEADALRSLLV